MAKSEVDEYIKKQPEEVQKILTKIRKIMNDNVPNGEEGISYGIPTIYLNGKYLVYFAGFKKHISVYPATTEAAQKAGLLEYKVYKGTLKFPLDEPIPYELIEKFVNERVKESKLKTSK